MAVAFVATVESGANGDNSLSNVDCRESAGANMCIVVAVAYINTGGNVVNGVVFEAAGGDEAFTQIATDNNGACSVDLWVLTAPSQEVVDVVVDMFANDKMYAGAITFEGCDQANAVSTPSVQSDNGDGTSCTQTIVSLVSEMSVNAIGIVDAGPPTATEEQTSAMNGAQVGLGDDVRGAAQYKASAGDKESMDWTISGGGSPFACVGCSLVQFGLGAINTNFRRGRRYQSRYRLTAHKVRT